MTKCLSKFLSGLLLFLLTASTAMAANPAEKFNKGLVEIITSPLEIAKQIDQTWKQSAKASEPASKGVFTGFFKGVGASISKLGSGLWNVATFPMSSPKTTGDKPKAAKNPSPQPTQDSTKK